MKKKQISIFFILPLIVILISLGTGSIFSVGFLTVLFRSAFSGIITLILCFLAKAVIIRYLPELIITEENGEENFNMISKDIMDTDDIEEVNKSILTQDNYDNEETSNSGGIEEGSVQSESNSLYENVANDERVEKITNESPEVLAKAIQTVLRQNDGGKTA